MRAMKASSCSSVVLKAEGVDAALVGHADQFLPAAVHQAAGGQIFAEAQQVRFVIAFAQCASTVSRSTWSGTSDAILDRVEIGNERDRDPVVAGDALVAGDHRAQFARLAAAQL